MVVARAGIRRDGDRPAVHRGRRAGAVHAGAAGHLLAPARRRRYLAEWPRPAGRSLFAHGVWDSLAGSRVAVAAPDVCRLPGRPRDAGAGARRRSLDPGRRGHRLQTDGRATADEVRVVDAGAGDRLLRLVAAAAAPDPVPARLLGLAAGPGPAALAHSAVLSSVGQRARGGGAGGRGAGGLHGGRRLALVAHARARRPTPRSNVGRRVAAGGAGRRGDTARLSHLPIRDRLGSALLRGADRGVVRPPPRFALRPAVLGRNARLRDPDRGAPAPARRRG